MIWLFSHFCHKWANIPAWNPEKRGNGGIFPICDPRIDPRGVKNDPRRKVPDPRCGAVFTARRGTCDPRALSRTIFDPVHFCVFFTVAELTGLRTAVTVAYTFIFTVRTVLLFVLQPRASPVAYNGVTGELAFCAVQQICSGSASAVHRKNLSFLGQAARCAATFRRSRNSRAHLYTSRITLHSPDELIC